MHIKGFVAGGLATNEAAVNSRKIASPNRCRNVLVVGKRRRPSAPANSSTQLSVEYTLKGSYLVWNANPWLVGGEVFGIASHEQSVIKAGRGQTIASGSFRRRSWRSPMASRATRSSSSTMEN